MDLIWLIALYARKDRILKMDCLIGIQGYNVLKIVEKGFMLMKNLGLAGNYILIYNNKFLA